MDVVKLREYEKLSPFEIKDFLSKAANKSAATSAVTYLNAGRGNPNWIATEPREAFFLLGQFAITESKRVLDLPPGVGGMPRARGSADRMAAWLHEHADMPGASFLTAMVPWAVKEFSFDADTFVHELVDSIIGDNYPVPDRMLVHNERIVHEYLQWAMCGSPRPKGTFELYAVEGGTAAMCYLFKSLKTNRLLNAGDTIALATPIFTPYLEMPHLEDYDLKIVNVQAKQENQVPVRRRRTRQAARSGGQGVLRRQSRESQRRRAERREHSEDRRHPGQEAGPDPADRRRVRHLRAGVQVFARRISRTTRSASTRTASTSAARAGGWA